MSSAGRAHLEGPAHWTLSTNVRLLSLQTLVYGVQLDALCAVGVTNMRCATARARIDIADDMLESAEASALVRVVLLAWLQGSGTEQAAGGDQYYAESQTSCKPSAYWGSSSLCSEKSLRLNPH